MDAGKTNSLLAQHSWLTGRYIARLLVF